MFLHNLIPEPGNAPGQGTRNRLIEYTQSGIAVGVTLVALYLYAMGVDVPDGLTGLLFAIVGFYFGKRADYAYSNGTSKG